MSLTERILYSVRELIDRPDLILTLDTPLVSSGLIDSFAMVSLIVALEEAAGVRLPPGAVQAEDMETVRRLVDTLARLGQPA